MATQTDAQASVPPPRRRPGVGYSRGDETRARIIEAALRVFGEEGFARASTRRIAADAGVKPPALQYYFDSKEGLHRACAEALLADAGALEEAIGAVADRAEPLEPAEAVDTLCHLLDALCGLARQADAAQGRARFLARAQMDGQGPAVELVRSRLGRPLQAVGARLVGAALRRDPHEEAVRLRTSLILAQASAVHAARENTLRALGWPDFDGDRLEAVKALLRAHTRAALGFAP